MSGRFYECVLIIPDIAIRYLMDLVNSVKEVVVKSHGVVHGVEYWGFRTLAYRIKKKGKAHYVCLGIELKDLGPLMHHLKFHRDLLRYMCIKQPEGLKFPTPLFQSTLEDLVSNSHLNQGSISNEEASMSQPEAGEIE